MKVIILAGGLGTRLAEETDIKPKPMVEIGDKPIIWHIMKSYLHYGHKDFYIALGYRGDLIKRYFLDYHSLSGDISINGQTDQVHRYQHDCEDWNVHLIDTGQSTMTGGRVKRLQSYVKDSAFMVTYGDGVGSININQLIDFHKSHGKIATITAVRPPSRFGGLVFDGDAIKEFTEKPQIGEGWINGGFMVFEPKVFDYLDDDSSYLEIQGLERLAADGQLAAYRHDGFWQCMDTLRDKRLLDSMWKSDNASWKAW